MRRPTPELHDLARRLLAHEADGHRDPEETAAAAERACQKLGEPMARLIGRAGFHSLLSRAVDLSASEFTCLRGIEVQSRGEDWLRGLREALRGRDPEQAGDASASILANVIWLLSVFVGVDLALRQVRRVWPDIPTGELESGSSEAKQ